MANDWSMCLIAKTNPKWHIEKQIHHQEQELQARVTAVYATTRRPSALFSCSMFGSQVDQDPASLSQPLNISHQWQNKPLPVAAGSAEEAQSFPEWTHHYKRFRGSGGLAGMHIHQRAHKGEHTDWSGKTKNTFPASCWADKGNAIRWAHDGIYHEILHCPEALWDWRKRRWSYGEEVKGVAKQCESLGVSVSVLGLMVYFGAMSLEPHMKYNHCQMMQLTNRSTLSLRPRDPCSTLSLPGVRM